MRRDSLDMYDTRPLAMVNYLRHYGMHFNKKLLEFAVSRMYKHNALGKKEYIIPLTKLQVDDILAKAKVKLTEGELYDYVYVANMCKADFYGSSIKTDEQIALYIKDVICDADAYDGMVFNRWYADMCRQGIPIEWEDML